MFSSSHWTLWPITQLDVTRYWLLFDRSVGVLSPLLFDNFHWDCLHICIDFRKFYCILFSYYPSNGHKFYLFLMYFLPWPPLFSFSPLDPPVLGNSSQSIHYYLFFFHFLGRAICLCPYYSMPKPCGSMEYTLVIIDLVLKIHMQVSIYCICLSCSWIPHSGWFYNSFIHLPVNFIISATRELVQLIRLGSQKQRS